MNSIRGRLREHPPLTNEEMESIHALYERNFDITPYVEEPAAARV